MKANTTHLGSHCSVHRVIHSSIHPSIHIFVLALIVGFAAHFRALATPQGLTASDWANIQQQAYLKASNPGAGDEFARAVAISGDIIVVGADYENSSATGVNGNQTNNGSDNSGAAYVFVREGTNWVQQAYLKASNARAGDRFGYTVAVSESTIVVGAPYESGSSGAAYVFVRSGTNWMQQAYLKASNAEPGDNFAFEVAVSGDTLVVGAFAEASNATGVNGNQSDNSAAGAGAAYIFVRNGTTWSQQAYLKGSNTRAGDALYKVAVSDNTVVLGAPREDSSATGVNGNQTDFTVAESGAAYVFVRNGTNWSQQAYLKASNAGIDDRFGFVSVSGDTVLVGASREDSDATGVNGDQNNNRASDSGAAYVFVRSGTNWSQQAYLKASNTSAADRFGWAMSLSGDTAVVGAHWEDGAATGVNGDQSSNAAVDSGAAYVFVRSGTNWTQQAYLKASNTEAADNFGGGPVTSSATYPGTTVAVSGDTVVVGAIWEDSNATGVNGDQTNNSLANSGAAYVFAVQPRTAAGNLAVDSQSRGNDTYGDWFFEKLEWGIGYPTINVTVDTDESLLYANGTQRQGLLDNLLPVGSQENDNPAFTSIYSTDLRFGWIVADSGTIRITYDFSFPTRLVDIMLFDVDEGDVARVEIRGANGESVPPSELEFLMEGDLSMSYNNPNRPQSEAATTPLWNPATGTLTAGVAWNENRSFTVFRPKVPVRQIVITHTGTRASTDRSVAPFIGSHILTALWATPRQFRITEFKRVNPGALQVTWPSLPGCRYEILESADLQTWGLVATIQGADSPAIESSSTIASNAGQGSRFYRIRMQP